MIGSSPASRKTTKYQKVLVAEENRTRRERYARELEREGYAVCCAADGLEAVRLARTERPDVVVLDIQMPVMSGLDAMSYILQEDPSLPVILNSAQASHRESFLSWSADAYLIKSWDLSELKGTIESLLQRDGG